MYRQDYKYDISTDATFSDNRTKSEATLVILLVL